MFFLCDKPLSKGHVATEGDAVFHSLPAISLLSITHLLATISHFGKNKFQEMSTHQQYQYSSSICLNLMFNNFHGWMFACVLVFVCLFLVGFLCTLLWLG